MSKISDAGCTGDGEYGDVVDGCSWMPRVDDHVVGGDGDGDGRHRMRGWTNGRMMET